MEKSKKIRRPVYVVQKSFGIINNEEAITIIAIKQTRIGAEEEKSRHTGAVVVQKFLVD